jgi:hypothetical protein
MGLSIDNFFRQAGPDLAGKQGEQGVFLREGGQLATTSAFSFFRSHSKARENDATAREFLNAIARDPVYKKGLDQAQAVLEMNRVEGKPLTARHIVVVKERMDRQLSHDLGGAIEFGQRLADAGVIPEGSGTSFGHFWMIHGRGRQELIGAAVPGELLRDFLQAEVVGQHVAKLCRDRGIGDDATTVHAIMEKTGALAQGLDRVFDGHDLDAHTLRFQGIMSVLNDSLGKTLDVLQELHAGGVRELKDATDVRAVLQTLIQAVDSGAMDRGDVGTLYAAIRMEGKDVGTAEGRSDAVRSFQLNELGAVVGRDRMTELGLPENLGSPLAHHPQVQSEARKVLDVMVQPPAIPTKEQAKSALEGALHAFMEKKLPEVREFVAMSTNPPIELKPKALSPATLPRFINVLLEEDGMLDPLLGGDMSPDFLQRVGRHSHVVESCTHGVTGDFGSDDFLRVQSDAIQLLLARRGLEPGQYKDMLRAAMEKFGPLASELTTVSLSCGDGSLRGPGVQSLHLASLGAYRALETHMMVMLRLVPEEALVEMNVPGRNHQERAGHLVDQSFQREIPSEELSDATRLFVRAHGVDMPDMSEDVRARLDGVVRSRLEDELSKARSETFEAVFDEFFPRGSGNIEENPVMFYTAFDEAARAADLTGINPDSIRAGAMYLAARDACAHWMTANPGLVDPARLREVAMRSIADSFGALKTTLDGIDALPEPHGRGMERGAFSAREKAVMKDVVQSTGLRDLDLVVRLAETARDKASGLKALCREQNSDKSLSEGVVDLASSFMPLARRLAEHPVPGSEEALGGMLMMTVGFSGLGQEELGRMFESLDGALGQQVSGAFNYCREIDDSAAPAMLAATRVMEEMRMEVGRRLGTRLEPDPFFFQQTVTELGHIGGEVMDSINRLRPHAFSDLDIALGRVAPPLGTAQMETLRGIAGRLVVSVPQESRFLLPYVMQGNARALLAVQDASGDRPLSVSRIWRAVTGHSAPWNLKEDALGGRLLGHVFSTYERTLRAACPDVLESQGEAMVFGAFNLGVPFPKLLELTRPGARLTQDDIALDLGMSSLKDYGPENAYGLTTDFRRRGRNTIMLMESADGRSMQTRPFGIPDEENVATHPMFTALIDHVRSMTVSPGQMARTLQALSQAALIMPRVLSTTFPGVQFSEHGDFSVTAVQQQDSTVTVDIDSDPNLPLRFHQRYVIEPGGDHRCAEFVMERR